MQRPESARSRNAWSTAAGEGHINDAFQASSFGSKASLQGSSSKAIEIENELYAGNPDGAETRQKEEIQEGCWWKFTEGIRALWTTRQTLKDTEDKDIYIKTTLRELVIYLAFIAILCVLTFGMTSSTMFYYTKVMTELFMDEPYADDDARTFRTMTHPFEFWTFSESVLMSGLYWESWYNGRNLTDDEQGFIYYESKLIGVPRLRQVRVKNGTCTLDDSFKGKINDCYGPYSSWNEFKGRFGPDNTSAWVFASDEALNGSVHLGTIADYYGGGFVQNLARKQSKSLEIVDDLKQKLWIDRGTRAVFIDFTVYNANINLFCVIRLLVEFPPTGGAVSSSSFRTVKLIRYVTVSDYIIMAFECIFVLFTIYYSVEEISEIKEHKLKYFTEFWNVLDIFILCVSCVLIIFSLYRTIKVSEMLDGILQNPDSYADFEYLAYWQSQFNNVIALAVFFAWIKVFKYISFNKTMTQLSATLARCRQDLLGFLAMFLIMFFAFAQLGNMMFGSQIYDFSSQFKAVFTLFRIILGDFDFNALQSAHRIFGTIYFFMYVFLIFFTLINMFLAIINDTYTEVKGDETIQNEFEVGEYFKKGYDKMMEKLNFKKNKLSDLQLTLASADVNNDQHLEFSEWRNDLKKKGYADTEIEAMFAKYDTDGDRILDPEEQRHLAQDIIKQKTSLNAEYAKLQQEAKEKEETPKALIDLLEDDGEEGETKRGIVDDGVPYDEYAVLARRVDRLEHSIGSIVSKIDAVLIKLETMEKAKARRKETMSKLLDSIIEGSNDTSEEEKKRQMENLVAQELAKWDEEMVNSSHSDLGTAHSRPVSSSSFQSRPATTKSREGF